MLFLTSKFVFIFIIADFYEIIPEFFALEMI